MKFKYLIKLKTETPLIFNQAHSYGGSLRAKQSKEESIEVER